MNGGDRDNFVNHVRTPLIHYTNANAWPSSYSHIIIISWDSGFVGGSCQFFVGPDHEPLTYVVKITDGPQVIPELRTKGMKGAFFVYFVDGLQDRFAGEATDEIRIGEHKVSIREMKRD